MLLSEPHELEALRLTLYQLRIGTGLTQSTLAERLTIPQSTISKIESGQRRLDLLELRRYCRAAGTSLPEFVDYLEKNIREAESNF